MRRTGLLPLVVLLACNTEGPTQPPEPVAAQAEPEAGAGVPEASDPGDGTPTRGAAADAERTAVADASPESMTTSEPGGDAPPPTTDEPSATAEPSAQDPAPSTSAEPVADLKLPSPIHAGTNDKCGKDPGVGKSLKSFSLPSARGGKPIKTGTYRGRVLVVNFWGTWCKPCLKELPEFDRLYRRYRKHGMTLLAIATDEDPKGVLEFADKRKLAAKLAIAGEDYAGSYGSPNFPFTFIVDHRGVIQASYWGYKPECTGQLEADIREQLEERAAAKARRAKKKAG
ncbi:MAG: redoxin domain-containing protein [Deltaproteobacteria bacterium]|nr:redoxin domain-containing protein [Deltaproteobacteria bacterium]